MAFLFLFFFFTTTLYYAQLNLTVLGEKARRGLNKSWPKSRGQLVDIHVKPKRLAYLKGWISIREGGRELHEYQLHDGFRFLCRTVCVWYMCVYYICIFFVCVLYTVCSRFGCVTLGFSGDRSYFGNDVSRILFAFVLLPSTEVVFKKKLSRFMAYVDC